MAAINRVSSWGVKPPFGMQINWGHPLARGLVFALINHLGLPLDLVSGRFAAVSSGTPAFSYGPEGGYLTGNVSYQFAAQTGLDRITTNGSFFLIGKPGPNATLAIHVGSFDPISTGNHYVGLGFDNNSSLQPNGVYGFVGAGTEGSGNGDVLVNSADYLGANSSTRFHRIGLTYSPDTSVSNFYKFGQRTSGIGFTATPPADANRRTNIFTNTYAGANNNSHNVLFYAWNRTLTNGEMLQLYLSPYAFIQPATPRILNFLRSASAKPWHYYAQQRRQAF